MAQNEYLARTTLRTPHLPMLGRGFRYGCPHPSPGGATLPPLAACSLDTRESEDGEHTKKLHDGTRESK